MRKRKMKSGIQAKYLKYMISLLLLALFLSSVGVWGYVQRNMTAVIVDKYEFSPLNKQERAISNEMIKEVCIPITVTRLGEITLKK